MLVILIFVHIYSLNCLCVAQFPFLCCIHQIVFLRNPFLLLLFMVSTEISSSHIFEPKAAPLHCLLCQICLFLDFPPSAFLWHPSFNWGCVMCSLQIFFHHATLGAIRLISFRWTLCHLKSSFSSDADNSFIGFMLPMFPGPYPPVNAISIDYSFFLPVLCSPCAHSGWLIWRYHQSLHHYHW